VVSISRQVVLGTMPLGGVLGGVVGRTLGLRAPFLLAAAVLTAVVLLALPVVNNRTVQAARIAAGVARRRLRPDLPCGSCRPDHVRGSLAA
jgi:hypothetical protein